ncbi:hypothetical protein RhiirA5_502859 [Rhizophagus irregularis]|uniref:Uncharacterized protein n=1 Tax=Rhizophagus irregularis TaxID=588596 RepID=A0A2N0PBW0_9GLOM|nr:hypothetical protein RhiirA5_502859 [Rhizophagus irregularis]
MQAFLTIPKYNKFYVYKTPTNQYQRFCNAFRYHRMVNTRNPTYPKVSLCAKCFMRINQSQPSISQNPKSAQTNQVLQRPIEEIILAELQQIYNSTNNLEIRNNLLERMATLKQVLHDEDNKIKKAKKARLLQEHQEVILYDSPGHPPFLTQYPNLIEHIHECIEFGAADKKRRKEIIKVRTIRHLREDLNSKYNEYLSCTTLNNYLLPSRSNTKAAKLHHHPAIVANASVSQSERNEHIDEHYCLISDDKAKVPLGIPAVGRTFQTLQSFQEPVTLPDHDFPISMQQKLIPSVYLLINPSDTNDTFRNGQLSIFIRPQYQVGTSSATHIIDLNSLTQDSRFDEILKIDSHIKPIWIILVDGGPDENPRHMKNIYQYCRMFHAFDLDYLSIRTHTPGQSSYNPIERQVNDSELAMKNFCYAGEALCALWEHDPIFGKPVTVQYTDQKSFPFDDIIFPGSEKEGTNESVVPWKWLETHTRMCQYSLDIKKCENASCYSPKRNEEAAILLAENDGFLPPVTKRKDGHFLNPIHILEYCDKLKIHGYDAHCPSINANTYDRLCCSECNAYFPTLSIVA